MSINFYGLEEILNANEKGMRRMRETQGMDEEETGRGEEPIEVSGDAAIIADAIAGGLGEIAEGMRMIAKALAGAEDSGVEDFAETYLDGARK